MFSPLETFQIIQYFPFFSNFSLIIIIVLVSFCYFLRRIINNMKLIPSKLQGGFEIFYQLIQNIIFDNLSNKGKPFIPFIFSLFFGLIILNIFGIIPTIYSTTAQISITFGISLSIWIGITLIGLSNHSFSWFSIFFPKGAPLLIAPLLVIIEFLSYSARAISLGVRLAANVTSGHILLNIISGFVYQILIIGGGILIVAIIPLFILIFLIGLELAVGLVQAYVFSLLTVIYIHDGLELH